MGGHFYFAQLACGLRGQGDRSCANATPRSIKPSARWPPAARAALFQPVMEAAIHLEQLPEMRPPRSALPVAFSLALARPSALLEHPAPERFRIDVEVMILLEVLSRQRGTKCLARAPILPPHQFQHLLAKLGGPGAIRSTPGIAVHQSSCALLPVARHQPLSLPVAFLQSLGGLPS